MRPASRSSRPAASRRLSLDRVDIDHNNGDGLWIDGSGGSGAINVAVADSSASFNASNGIDALSGAGNAIMSIMRVVAAANGVAGIAARQTSGGIASVTVGSSVLYGNTIAAQATGGAGLLSYSNNQVTATPRMAALPQPPVCTEDTTRNHVIARPRRGSPKPPSGNGWTCNRSVSSVIGR
jgi:hypothetical protein